MDLKILGTMGLIGRQFYIDGLALGIQGGNLSGPLALPASFSGILVVSTLFS